MTAHPEAARPGTKPGDESPEPALSLFRGFGVEIEYMIVDAGTLDVRPAADRFMAELAGSPVAELESGPLAWSNELPLHVLEVKTNGPAEGLRSLAGLFHGEVRRANGVLAGLGCRLLPGGMHPWMDPRGELRLWPHEYTEVYRTFDRIFSCRGHGWANLQSTHLNLPFRGDREFAALHAAVRILLPLLPALAASSPVRDGKVGTHLDERLRAYVRNAARVPSVTGLVVPEPARSRAEYEERVLARIYGDLAPLDPEGVLRHEWVNARGAIPRFDRGTVEIRVLDAQECPAADVAVLAVVVAVVRKLCLRAMDDPDALNVLDTETLARILGESCLDGELARVGDRNYLEALGVGGQAAGSRAGEIWALLVEEHAREVAEAEEWRGAIEAILDRGPLARRLLRALGRDPSPGRLRNIYGALADCLMENRPFP